MAKYFIADETIDSQTAQVFGNKSLKVSQRYKYVSLVSATATGSVFTGAGHLHSVIFQASAAGASFWLFDNGDSATAAAIGASASAVARYSGLKAQVDLYNVTIGSGLLYRLSAAVADGITIVYVDGN